MTPGRVAESDPHPGNTPKEVIARRPLVPDNVKLTCRSGKIGQVNGSMFASARLWPGLRMCAQGHATSREQ